MEKCVFMGYPSGYKGWLFYNPNTQKYVISERAEFDERVFPGLSKYKATSPADLTPPNSLPLQPIAAPEPLLNLEGISDEDDCKTASLPAPEHAPDNAPLEPPINLPPPDLPPMPPIVPPVIPGPPRHTQHISHPPGKWWKVKHQAEPEAEPPVIWSDDEEDHDVQVDDDQQAN